ncbi:MAG: HNH endonuclease, partial [Solirubrobacterales bacterium]
MFELGQVYRRADLHAEYGGQQQGGIITPAAHPLIFVVTGDTGRQYGYHDHWDDAGVFHYYGEGQTGDMGFKAGNAAVLRHGENEEELHLFERVRPGYLRYRGEMACSGYEMVDDDDSAGNLRKAIVFQLVPPDDAVEPDSNALGDLSLEQLRDAADEDPAEESDPQEGRRRTYRRSRALKAYVRARA